MGSDRRVRKLNLLGSVGKMALSLVFLLGIGGIGLAEVAGAPRIIGGDTIVIEKERIRLHGIDAPEQRQSCFENNIQWACGQEATVALKMMVCGHVVRCKGSERDRYGRVISLCFAAGLNLNEQMV
mgnify:FL=1